MSAIEFCGSQRRHQLALLFAVGATLSACASNAPLSDSKTTGVNDAGAVVVPLAPLPADVDAPTPSTEALPSDAEIIAPTCVPAETKPKPKPRPKPVQKEAPPQPQTDESVVAIPAGGVIDADVKPLNTAVVSILGKKVQGPKGEDLGRVVDVLADASGRVRVAIIDFGGFLGVGNRRIAVDWPLLRFNPDGQDKSLILSLSREKLQSAPEYTDSTHPQALMVPLPAAPAAAAAEGKQ